MQTDPAASVVGEPDLVLEFVEIVTRLKWRSKLSRKFAAQDLANAHGVTVYENPAWVSNTRAEWVKRMMEQRLLHPKAVADQFWADAEQLEMKDNRNGR